MILSLMRSSIATSTENLTKAIDIKPDKYGCLTHDQKVNIAVCFESNRQCHEALDKVTQPSEDYTQTIYISLAAFIAGSLLGGYAISQAHK